MQLVGPNAYWGQEQCWNVHLTAVVKSLGGQTVHEQRLPFTGPGYLSNIKHQLINFSIGTYNKKTDLSSQSAPIDYFIPTKNLLSYVKMAPFYVLIMQTSSMHEGQLLMDIEINLYKREITILIRKQDRILGILKVLSQKDNCQVYM